MSNQEIKLPCFGIVVNLTTQPVPGFGNLILPGGSISSNLEEPCECNHEDAGCCPTCDYNTAMDGIESLILGHACAGVDIATPAYIEGIESAVQGAAANI